MAIYIVFLPISGTIALRNLAFFVLALLTMKHAVSGNLKLYFPICMPWIVYAGVALLSLTYAVDVGYSFYEIKTEFVFPILITILGASCVCTPERFERLIYLLVVGNVLFVFGSGWSYLHPDSVRDAAGLRSFNTGVGDVAAYITATFPFLLVLAFKLREKKHSLYTLGLGALIMGNFAAIYLSFNRQAWLSIVASMCVMAMLMGHHLWSRKRVILASLVLVCFAVVALIQYQIRFLGSVQLDERGIKDTVQFVAHDPRLELWSFCLPRIADEPFSGGGFGREALKLKYPDFTHSHPEQPFWHCHNMVINKGIQMGVPGVIAFLTLWIALIVKAKAGLKVQPLRMWAIAIFGMMAAVFVRNMTDDFFYRDHLLLFWLMSGSFLGVLRNNTSSSGSSNFVLSSSER